MLFIAGADTQLEVVGHGQFYCPECEDTSGYILKQVKERLSLFFIPVWRSAGGETCVECKSCGTLYEPEVLEWEPPWKAEFDALLAVATECGSIALECKDPDLARMNYERAVQSFRQLQAMNLSSEIRQNTENTLQILVDEYPSQSCIFHALGICDQAEKVGHVDKQLPLLIEARGILEQGLERRDVGYDAIMSIYTQVVDRIEKGEALSRKLSGKDP